MILPLLIMLSLIIIITILFYIHQKFLWNGGICKDTGKPWELFDTDSQGGRGYKSENHWIWISYPFVDTHKQKGK
jgi:hypothetical protein